MAHCCRDTIIHVLYAGKILKSCWMKIENFYISGKEVYLLLVVILGQYILLIAVVMFITWIDGRFNEVHKNAYRDMFLSCTVPYVIGVIIYYSVFFHGIKAASQTLREIKEHQK